MRKVTCHIANSAYIPSAAPLGCSTRNPVMPPPKNPPIPSTLRKRCRAYLQETHHSEWLFTDFWNGDEDLRSGYGDVWLKALQDILKETDDEAKVAAAIDARNNYKERAYLPPSTRRRARKAASKPKAAPQRYPSETPPSYVLSSDPPLGPAPQTLHEQKFHALAADRKWHLPGGRTVEDVLFGWVVSQSDAARRLKQKPQESYAHSYILDVDDPVMKRLFDGRGEWDEIVSRLLPTPPLNASLTSFMYKFAGAKTAAELRKLLMTTAYVPPDEDYSSSKHGDQAWVHSLLTSLVVLYEHDHMSRTDNLETWFQINVWGPIFDRCFQHIPKMSLIRAESQSPSNSERKHTHTDPTLRKPVGRKYDGLIIHNKLEYGAVEDSKHFDAAKWTSDSLKLAKLLHDQLRALESEVMHDPAALWGFRCVGFLTAGLRCRGMYMQYGKGHVCLLKRSARSEMVPEEVLPMYKLFRVLEDVWRMRAAVMRSVGNLTAFHERMATGTGAEGEEEGAEIIPPILQMCLDTDAEF